MKTQNNTQTKVNTRVTIVVLYISTIVFSLAVIGLKTNAQQIWSQQSNNSPYGTMASLMVDFPSETANTDAAFEAIDAEIAFHFNHSNTSLVNEPEMEETFEVENWMTNEANFSSNTLEAEETLRVEDWMIDSNNFGHPVISESVDLEEHLEVEPWMTSEEVFNSAEVLANGEPAMEVEAWMTDQTFFNSSVTLMEEETDKLLNVEEWMTSELNFNNQAALIVTGSEPEQALEAWMLNEDHFKVGESFMAELSKQVSLRYAHKQVNRK